MHRDEKITAFVKEAQVLVQLHGPSQLRVADIDKLQVLLRAELAAVGLKSHVRYIDIGDICVYVENIDGREVPANVAALVVAALNAVDKEDI